VENEDRNCDCDEVMCAGWSEPGKQQAG